MERLQERFRKAKTQVLGVSIDSKFCHAGWAVTLGGISFPLLSDFHPKGATAKSYGLYLEDAGITDRATVIIDADGIVQHSSSVSPSGERDIEELAALCEEVDAGHKGELKPLAAPAGIKGATLYVKSRCGFSAWTLHARANLHLEEAVQLKNVSENPEALKALKDLTGKEQAPCLVLDGKPILESADIIQLMVSASTDLP